MKSFSLRVYILAVALRIIPVFLTRGLGIGLDDMYQYDMLARSLAEGNGYRWYSREDMQPFEPYVKFDLSTAKDYDPDHGIYTSFRAPLYPAFLALVYFFNGVDASRFFAARLAQAILLGAPLAPLTYCVSRGLFPEAEQTARVAALIMACYPMLLIYPLGFGTENLFFLLLLVSFLFLLKSIETSSVMNFILAGFFLALTALTRSAILLFVPAAFGVLFFVNRRKAFLFIAVFFAAIAPWTVRNSLLHGTFTGVETSLGYNLYLGYHPEGNGSFVFGPSLELLSIMDDAQRDKIGAQKAMEFIQAQPDRFIPLAVNRLGFFFGLEKRVLMYFYSNNILGFIPKPLLISIAAILLLPFMGVSVSAALGASFLQWNSRSFLLVLLCTTYIIPHVLILSEDRFHLALIPYFAILAARFWSTGFRGLAERWNKSARGKLILSASVLCILLLITNWGLELARDADTISQLLGPNGNQTYFPY